MDTAIRIDHINPAGVYFVTHALTTYRRCTMCTRQPSSGSPTWVSAIAYLNTQVSSPGLSLFRFHPQGVRPRFPHTAPNDVCRVPGHQTGDSVHRATSLPHHSPPLGQRCPWPPAYYKHQKLRATPGQRTRVIKKPRGSIGFGPNVW